MIPELQHLAELEAKATKGPWCPWEPPINGGEDNPDCILIAEMRNALPLLLTLADAAVEEALARRGWGQSHIANNDLQRLADATDAALSALATGREGNTERTDDAGQ